VKLSVSLMPYAPKWEQQEIDRHTSKNMGFTQRPPPQKYDWAENDFF
jgi:hypothetical protein